MSSPVLFHFYDSISIDRSAKEALYLQIVKVMINGIEKGKLTVGVKLPGTRVLADKLGVHRKTIIAAYQELEAQGWISMKESVGSYVLPTHKHQIDFQLATEGFTLSQEVYPIKVKQSNLMDSPFESHNCSLSINDGQPDYRLNSMDELTRMYRNSLKRKQILRKLGDQQFNNTDVLKDKLIRHIQNTRGISVTRSQIIRGRSAEMLLFILGQILLNKSDVVLVGELSFFSANMILQQVGAKVKTVPMDEKGLDVDYIEEHFKKGDFQFIYINPQNNYPNTVTLAQERRTKLIELAEKMDFVIIEEEREEEFYFERKSLEPLIAQCKNGRVVYIGAFGRSLLPTFQTFFVLAPDYVINEVEKHLGLLEGHGDIIIEQALGEWVESGEMNRQMKKMLKTYKERRNACLINLDEIFAGEIEFSIPSGGLAIWISFKRSFSLTKWADYCKQKDLFIPRHCLYQNRKLTALRLGFGNLSVDEMKKALEIMKQAYAATS